MEMVSAVFILERRNPPISGTAMAGTNAFIVSGSPNHRETNTEGIMNRPSTSMM